MRTLTSSQLRRIGPLRADLPWILAWLGALAGIELLGRRASSDVGDAVGVAVLSSLALSTWIRHTNRPLAFVARGLALARRLTQRFAPLKVRIGLDLRRDPPLPERLPPVVGLPLALVLGACALAWFLRAELPGGARAALSGASCALYVALLSVLWAALAAGTLVSFSIPLVYLDEALKRSRRLAPAREPALVWAGLVYLVLLVALASLAPPHAPLVACLVAQGLFLAASLRKRGASLSMVWKSVDPPSEPAVFRWSTLTSAIQLGGLALFVLLVLLARGDSLASERAGTTPLTAFLGLALSWSFLGAFLVELVHLSSVVAGGWYRNPAEPERPRVRCVGEPSRAAWVRARAHLVTAGFAFAGRHARRRATEVPIELVEREGTDASREWPRRVSSDELADGALHAALRRRSELLCRRALRKGLERIFKEAARRKFERGSGYWVAPHHWFVTHLTRDVDEDVLGHVGPSYARAIPLAARRHFHQVLGALEVDLLFVEDGVRFSSLKRVLAMLFEHYDIFGGARLADERHFSGLPGVRVMLHDYVLDEPFRAKGYPEPEYEDLGRARILHVFRDRGDATEDASEPRDADWLPAPSTPELALS